MPDADPETERPLAANPCRSLCAWTETPLVRAAGPVLACRGCGSQWAADAGWLPLDLDGSVPAAARRARQAARRTR